MNSSLLRRRAHALMVVAFTSACGTSGSNPRDAASSSDAASAQDVSIDAALPDSGSSSEDDASLGGDSAGSDATSSGSDASSSNPEPDAAIASTSGLIQNDVFWKDTAGNTLYSQSGNVIKAGATWYWYGNQYQGAVAYAANPTAKSSESTFDGVTCYSSTDLVHWQFENTVLVQRAVPGSAASDWFGRMGVAYSANTRKYVLIMEYIPAGGNLGEEIFATSDTPTGAFVFDHIQAKLENVVNNAPGDQTVFTDDDGQAYLILSSADGRSNLYVAPLRASDFLAVESATRIFGGAGREGNCMFKYNGRYYFNSSDLHGWNASHTYTLSATNILGPYSAESVMANTNADFSHVTQTGFFITVHGTSQSTVIFAGDRWSDFAGNGIGFNQWVPLTFVGTEPQFQSLSQWSFDAVTGTWSVGPDNNYALNPSFEADRVTMTQPAGWTTSTNLGGATPYSNVEGGHSGRWKWRLTDTSGYQAAIAQTVTGLPDGTYTLSGWIQSSGGQALAQLFANSVGAAETDASLNTAIPSWTKISVVGIAVTNGSCEIGVRTTASANQWVDMDDFALTKN